MTGTCSPHSVLINGIPRHIRDIRPRHRSVTSEDDGSNSSSESDWSTPLLYGTEPGDSSTELEEAESDNDDAENERGPLNSVTEEVRESRPIYVQAVVEDDRHPHAIYVIVRSGKWIYPRKKLARVCLACKSENGRSNSRSQILTRLTRPTRTCAKL